VSGGKAEKRIALVIGNAAYRAATVLANPVNDALQMTEALERLGFEVKCARDCDINEFDKQLRDFRRKLAGSDAGLFYYSGHALQFGGENYLIPIDARLEEPEDLERRAFSLSPQLAAMRAAAGVSIVFLDACRDDPFKLDQADQNPGAKRVIVQRTGLKEVAKANLKDALIAFAAEQGHTAVDGEEGGLSPFTKALVDNIETPGLEITNLMRRVRQRVREATNGKQTPWSNESLTNPFFFKATPSDRSLITERVSGEIATERMRTVYEQPKKEGYGDFKDYGSKTYTKEGPIGAVGEGNAKVLKAGIIEIRRINTEGRWILQFQNFRAEDGKSLRYISARGEAGGQRTFEISLEARAIGGPHRLRLAFRTHPDEEFVQDAFMLVDPGKWQKFGRLMIPRADKDMYFFLESSDQRVVSSVQVRNLVLREKY
jgi:hypothetical protein